MTISVWRYSHLALAVSSFLLLILASVTGIILSFESISNKAASYRVNNFNEINLAQTLPALRKTYPDISELTVTENGSVQIKASDAEGKNLTAYVDPITGKILGIASKKSEFFEWVRTLHRSLFLHETGRFFIGITAFLLLLITISGTILIIQRQRGVKRFFTKIVKDNFAQYYHVVLGRLLLIPVFIIAISGTYLSLSRFGLVNTKKVATKVDFDVIKSQPEKRPADIVIFKNTLLSQVESIEFPFSEDVEDYYTLKLNNSEVAVNQVTGEVLSEVKYPLAVILTNISLNLHTGRTSIIWAVVLIVASGNILFFIWSGFAMTFKRRANRITNKFKANECRFVILVGSENGSTFSFAQTIHLQLLKQGEKSFLTELNNFSVYPEAEHLLVLTATYGVGDAPTNANRFISLLAKHQQTQQVKYSVIGFGSHAYPDFCKFAFEANQLLSKQNWATPLVDIHTVNDKSPHDFALWAEAWSQQANLSIPISPLVKEEKHKRLATFTVTSVTRTTPSDATFLVRLKTKNNRKITSGDLLAIYPANDHRERLYSIGMVNHEIQLNVRLHEGGLGSGFLNSLKPGDVFSGHWVANKHFHFPKKAPGVIMIANGTGIAPFLGMIGQNVQSIHCHLYCGFREKYSFDKHRKFLEESRTLKKLDHLHVAFSRESQKQYVSDLIKRDADFIAEQLNANGVIMLCGSLAMQKDVMKVLNIICETKLNNSLSFYQSRDQIRTDCY
ncbi:PepSY domain-containing protein [Mucilaginibacter terrae]|uniref:PepSY domain-containing protein n=1 Tax=Mucilaginibacter terrae TaxID=1955052 RepID=UPI00362AA3D6